LKVSVLRLIQFCFIIIFEMPGGKKSNKSPRRLSLSPRGRSSTRDGGGVAAEDNLFRVLANVDEDGTNVDGNTDADERKIADEVEHSDDSTEHVPFDHGGGFPTMAAMQQSNPGGVFIPLTHPNYTSFLKKHLNSPSPGFRLPSDSFTKFLPDAGQQLPRVAAGFQTYVYSGQPPSDSAFTKHQSETLDQLSAFHGFDVTIFANLDIPDDALTSPVIVAVRDLFNDQLKPRIKFLNGNFQTTIIASPDLAVATAGDHSDVGCLLTDLCFDPKADPMVNARHYGRINMPMHRMVKPGFGPYYRRPQGYDPEDYALVYSFNEAQFDPQIQYFRRDSLYQLRELGALNRVLFLFFRGLAARITALKLTWASTFESQLDALEKQSASGTLVDLSILPTFAYFAMKKLNADCFLGALAYKAFLSNFSQSALSVHHKAIGNLYKFHLSGTVPVLNAFTAFETLYEQVKESAVHPQSVVLPHPALAENLIVPVFTAAMVDLAKRAASLSAGHFYGIFKAATDTAVTLWSFDALRKLLSVKSFAELGPIMPSGMVAAAVSDSKSVVSRQRSHTPQPPDTHSRQRSQTPQPPNPPAAAVSAKQSKPRKAPSSKPADAPPLAVQPRSPDVMFKSIPEYVVFVGGLFFARCDSAGDKVTIPKQVYHDLPVDTRNAFKLLKPFSFVDIDGSTVHPAPAVSHLSGKKQHFSQRQPKPPNMPVKSAPVLAATSVGSSPHNASSASEPPPPPGLMVGYDPRFGSAPFEQRQLMHVPFGPQAVPYGAPMASTMPFLPPDSTRPVAYSAPPDPYALSRAPVPFPHSQAFFASPAQHQSSQFSVPVRTNYFDVSGGGYSRVPSGGYQDVSGGGYPRAPSGGYQDVSGGGYPRAPSGGYQDASGSYQGSSPPPSQQSSHSGKMLLGDGRVGRDTWC